MCSSLSHRGPVPWLIVAGVAAVLVLALATVAFATIYRQADIPPRRELRPRQPTVMLDASGRRAGTLEPGALGDNVELSGLPDHVWQATLAAEDRSFFHHRGFSVSAILRAAWVDLTAWELVQGGSTITQQYVDLAVTDVRETFPGKFREVAIATKLEQRLPKRTILELYHNTVAYGRGAVGINAAARTYFRTAPDELSVDQAAVLAGMIRSPSALDPAEHPTAARRRRNEVLTAMATEGWISGRRARQLRASPLPEVTGRPPVSFGGANSYFLDAVRSRVPKLLEDADTSPATGLVVATTLRPDWQATARRTLRDHLGGTPYTGSVVTIDPATGAVRALIGGLDFRRQRFNIATQARRGAGSSFKPYVLSSFVASGGSPDSLVRAPAALTVTGAGGRQTIHNYSGHGWGPVPVRTATVNSINTAYVNLGREVGLDRVVETADRMGVGRRLAAVPANMIGAGGVTPLAHTSGYATLAAGGMRHEPYLIREIRVRGTGEVLYRHEGSGQRVLDRNVAAMVTDVLTDVIDEGTGNAARLARPVAGKTGTTDDYRDAWFVGYTPGVTTSVWVGNRDFAPMDGVTGGSIPARTWADYMREITAGRSPRSFPAPRPSALQERLIDGEPGTDLLDDDTSRYRAEPAPDDGPPSTPGIDAPNTTSAPDTAAGPPPAVSATPRRPPTRSPEPLPPLPTLPPEPAPGRTTRPGPGASLPPPRNGR